MHVFYHINYKITETFLPQQHQQKQQLKKEKPKPERSSDLPYNRFKHIRESYKL